MLAWFSLARNLVVAMSWTAFIVMLLLFLGLPLAEFYDHRAEQVIEDMGLPGDELARSSRLVAKVDSAAVRDGFELYLHNFVVADDGAWVVVQQGMKTDARQARRYHWLSEGLEDFVDLVIPELQRRGLFRTEYQGRTLREHLSLRRPGHRS